MKVCTFCNSILDPSAVPAAMDRPINLFIPSPIVGKKIANMAKRRHLVGRCHSDTSNLDVKAQIARVAAATSSFLSAHDHHHRHS